VTVNGAKGIATTERIFKLTSNSSICLRVGPSPAGSFLELSTGD
jgi:hypothetical protein